MFHLVGKQTYKLKLPRKWKIHNLFHLSLLEQDNIKKERMNKFVELPKFDKGDNKKYKMGTIQDNAVYTKETNKHLPELYYLVI